MTANHPVALITGAARRIGAQIAETLHRADFNVVLHYRNSATAAEQLAATFNQRRPDSAICLAADLCQSTQVQHLAEQSQTQWGRVDALINNASSFYPTPIGSATEAQWDDLLGSNVKAPFFLSQALAAALTRQRGAIINIADIHADRPLAEHTVYCIAKAGNVMLTQSLARELAPAVRVNGIAPGAILWPEQAAELSDDGKQKVLGRVPLARPGAPADIAATVLFLLTGAPYITGQVIAVDGGRSLT
ncbi:pteridine reductase [Exilibacterium tricleocarpae]|uniref:Pteridine reductase n=1 Tax=Exilibacterium tricleocarpae TaxID=2591008 RepID=A0A545T3K6_9GAMM|nr:pteridine reductase [Exilibacterium tricleocarpae]TQV71799.1 pteridine reductase [Exilibacterium tricleocarpae]